MFDVNSSVKKEPYAADGCACLCPLHVNPRVLLKKRMIGDFKGAYKYYKSRVLFPELISATCSGSCSGQSAGSKSSYFITNIEKACTNVEIQQESGKGMVLSKEGKRAAIIGGGLGGMAAAAFLRNYRYEVHVYEKTEWLGGSFRQLAPRKSLLRELYEIADMPGMRVLYRQRVDTMDICEVYDAVCNTGIEAWRTAEQPNLFHVFGETPEAIIAGAIKAGQQIVKYLNG